MSLCFRIITHHSIRQKRASACKRYLREFKTVQERAHAHEMEKIANENENSVHVMSCDVETTKQLIFVEDDQRKKNKFMKITRCALMKPTASKVYLN